MPDGVAAAARPPVRPPGPRSPAVSHPARSAPASSGAAARPVCRSWTGDTAGSPRGSTHPPPRSAGRAPGATDGARSPRGPLPSHPTPAHPPRGHTAAGPGPSVPTGLRGPGHGRRPAAGPGLAQRDTPPSRRSNRVPTPWTVPASPCYPGLDEPSS